MENTQENLSKMYKEAKNIVSFYAKLNQVTYREIENWIEKQTNPFNLKLPKEAIEIFVNFVFMNIKPELLSGLRPLNSVGCLLDSDGNTYPMFSDGTPDLSNGINLTECSIEWFESLNLLERSIVEEKLHQLSRDLMQKLDEKHGRNPSFICLEEYKLEHNHTPEETQEIRAILDAFYKL